MDCWNITSCIDNNNFKNQIGLTKDVVILGGGESGVGAALLAKKLGLSVFLSDGKQLLPAFKKELDQAAIEYEENGHSVDLVYNTKLLIKSPGISDNLAVIQQFHVKQIPVISEIEFAYKHCQGKVIGITGSNGKSTTTKLIHHLLHENGIDAALGGNIGKSFARIVAEGIHPWYVIEISSFQLDGTKDFKPEIAVLLNITPDHLDRYNYDFSLYANSKFLITKNQNKDDHFIYFGKDQGILDHLKMAKGHATVDALEIKINHKMELVVGGFELSIQKIPIKGEHNLINSSCAIKTAQIVGLTNDQIKNAIVTFENLPHRLEFVQNIKGIDFINDSKATNVDSVSFALRAMDKPIIWIAGGTDKGNDYTLIEKLVDSKVKALVCLGINNAALINAFKGQIDQIAETQSAESAVRTAYAMAKAGDVVLLSPACASFDLFQNYEDRGDQFRAAVKKLGAQQSNNN